MAKTLQLLCLLVAVALSYDNKWNTADPLVKFYCEAEDLKKVANHINNVNFFLIHINNVNIFTGDNSI